MKILSIILWCSVVVFAEVSTMGLSDEDVSALKIQAEQMRLNKGKVTVDTVKEYVTVGKMIGEAFASCAKEIGVAVNDFVQTPVGKITGFLIVYKIIGRDIMHFAVGFLFLCVFIPLYIYMLRRFVFKPKVEYGPGWWIFRSKKVSYTGDWDGETMSGWLAVMGVIIAVSQIIMWS